MTNNTILDQDQREQALDPSRSFIVQAPAGSGKTELLTQRFLRLLSCVNEPEEILAITFTKKASAEMRSRIRDALLRAQHTPLPQAPHEQKTWLLAQQALKQDQAHSWDLLSNPNRLRIKTIDAFNTFLTRQLPLLSHFGASPEIMDYPHSLYREAVQSFLTHLEENLAWSSAIAELLLHLDNNYQDAEKLLIEMLSKRDQWLPHLLVHPQGQDENSLRQLLETDLTAIIKEKLKELRAHFPPSAAAELISLLQFACGNLKTINLESPLLACEQLTDLPGMEVADLAAWQGIAKLLLKEDESWRKTVDKDLGFPAADKKQELNAANKKRMKELLEELSVNEKLLALLADLLHLPQPQYSDTQWKILRSLHDILKIAVAQLNVLFKLTGKIDYTENALAALLALGREEAPTDLALVLDYQLKHILVDEFQDTSNNQYELLEKLVAGWQPDDGRSLFLVGDPMQSIYRFREADVGLFLRARQIGLGPVQLHSLTLSVNFRSQAPIVEWINSHFNRVLPPFDDIASGAVSYTPSIAGKKGDLGAPSSVQLHCYNNAQNLTQTQGIIRLIQQSLAQDSQGKIAILVRSRSHLKLLIPALKAAQLPYQAVDIDALQTRPLIQDLLALTRALLYPADQLAWFSILRAPWCGLSLSDLLILGRNQEPSLLLHRLRQVDRISQLSPEGQQRIQRIMPVLESALAERHREDLHLWVEKTWQALGGPGCVETEAEQQDAKVFLALLKKLTQNELSLNLKWAALEEALTQLYAQSQIQANCRIQIMTIHNAKGLEFDTVILPCLEKANAKQDKPLLAWLEQPLVTPSHNTTALLLAPIPEAGDKNDKIYRHILRQDKNKTQHEQARLLYVAVTRAKKHLHLCLSLDLNEHGEYKLPAEGSMLRKLWSTIKHELQEKVEEIRMSTENNNKIPLLKRLPASWIPPFPQEEAAPRPAHNKIQGFHLSHTTNPIMGTVIHYLLQQISNFGFSWWENTPLAQRKTYLKTLLIKNYLLMEQLEPAIQNIEKAIRNTLTDPRGQWLLQAQNQAQTEWPLTLVLQDETKTFIIDKTFVDENNQRWIIDYKSSTPESAPLEKFLLQEKVKYAEQMQHYYQALSLMDQRTIKMGLYFPLIPAWCEF